MKTYHFKTSPFWCMNQKVGFLCALSNKKVAQFPRRPGEVAVLPKGEAGTTGPLN